MLPKDLARWRALHRSRRDRNRADLSSDKERLLEGKDRQEKDPGSLHYADSGRDDKKRRIAEPGFFPFGFAQGFGGWKRSLLRRAQNDNGGSLAFSVILSAAKSLPLSAAKGISRASAYRFATRIR